MCRWVLSGADVQAPWHGVLETVWFHCDEAQQVGCLRGLEDCPLVWDAGIPSQFARRRWWWGQWGGSSPWSCGACACRAAIAAACRWGHGAIQCRRLLWYRQTQVRPSSLPRSYAQCLASARWPELRSTSRVESPLKKANRSWRVHIGTCFCT